jgi:hypothetical protein
MHGVGGFVIVLPTRLVAGLKVAPASPTPSPAMSLPAIDEMGRNAEKRQADYPVPKKSSSEKQGCACHENDPLDHAEERRLGPLREGHPQLSFDYLLHFPTGVSKPRIECLVIAKTRD